MEKILDIPHVLKSSHSTEFEGYPLMLTVSECDHCKTLILESKIVGIYTFITDKQEANDTFTKETQPIFLTQNYVVLENGHVIDEKITFNRKVLFSILEVNVNGFYDDSPETLLKKCNCTYQHLSKILKTHTSFVQQMQQSIKHINSLYQAIHLIPSNYHPDDALEGILMKKKDLEAYLDSPENIFEIDYCEKRYIYFKNKFTSTSIYYLKRTHFIAIESPSFFKSDVYLLDPDTFRMRVI